MAQCTAPAEPHVLPPPIPVRSRLRNGSAYQQRLLAIQSTPSNSESALLFPVSQTPFEKLDRELTDTQQRLASAILEGKNMIGKRDSPCWGSRQENNTTTDRMRTAETLGDFCSTEVGSEVSYCDGHPKPLRSDLSDLHLTASSTYSQHTIGERSKRLVEQVEVQGCVPSVQGSRDCTTSATHVSHANHSNNTSPSSGYSAEKMDTKVSDWLVRGFLSPSSDEPGSPKQTTSNSNRRFPPRDVSLSLFPPASPSTGRREYTPPRSPLARPACSMSPLNNGRDAYGNYIPSNKRDYLTAHSPLTSPKVQVIPESHKFSEQGISAPMVRLRGGGWNGFKSFWKPAGTEEFGQSFSSTSLQHSVGRDSTLRGIPPTNYAGRSESRAPRSVRSRFCKIDRTIEGTPRGPSAIDTRRDGQLIERRKLRQGSNTPDSTGTDDSSTRRTRTEAVLYQHFGPQLSPLVPMCPETRPLTVRELPTTYGRADVPIRDGPLSHIDKTFAPPNVRSALPAENKSMVYSTSPSHPVAKIEPTSWQMVESQETQCTDSTLQSHVVAPRANKRWDRENPLPPPRLPPTNPPRFLRADPPEYDAPENFDDDIYRASSMLSANTLDNNLMDVLGLENTDAYKRVEHGRAIQRIQAERRGYEEADRRRDLNVRQHEELQQREPALSTIVPDDSVTVVMRRQPIDRWHDLERTAALSEHRPPSSSTPSQYLPRHGHITAKARVIPRQQNAQHRTIGYPSIVTASEPVESVSVKCQNSLQTVISKAGEITRFILAAPSGSRYKTYSKRQPPVECQEEKQPGLGADTTGWPRNGKSFSMATDGMLISTQAPNSKTTLGHDQSPNSRGGQTQPDNRGWEHPRGRRVRKGEKIEKTENGRRGGKWGRKLKEDAFAEDVPESMRGGGSSAIPAANINPNTTRSRGATRLQHPGFARRGPRARSSSPKALTPLAGPLSDLMPMSQQLQQNFTAIDSAGTLQTRLHLPDNEDRCYVRRDDGDVLPFNPTLGYPHHLRLNTYCDIDKPDVATLKWLERICARPDAIAEPAVNMRGGGVLSTNGEASSLTSHHRFLTSEAMSLYSGDEAIDSSDIDALLMSSTHLNLDQVTNEAMASNDCINGDDTKPSLDGANVRSSFSTDSTVELRQKKKAKENVWRDEDRARAMAMAMHSIG
ncbi:hypothetical protein G6011_08835 [Alternaria panax]|uniref:Uncharacterized protein n=1 Tax=Alternaria panax TaxID=48097 RepID=A0AAD4FIN6_9PLEO|nr:hypothetical protein G6011_08835 [Alternaria panax]